MSVDMSSLCCTLSVVCLLFSITESHPLQDDVGSNLGPGNWLTQMDNDTVTDPGSVIELGTSLVDLNAKYTDISNRFETYKQTSSTNMETLLRRLQDMENIIGNLTTPPPKPSQIGFSATLSTKQTHVQIGAKVIFDHVYFQSGGAYNKRTGIFTAPQGGLYLFSIFCHSSDGKTLVMSVKVDGSSRTVCVSEPAFAGEDDTGGNMFVSQLTVGQRVWVEIYEVGDASIYPSFTTFSGALIQGQ